MAIKKRKGTFQEVKFDPKAWSENVEMGGIAREVYTHICNVRRCWSRGAIADMIWNADMAEIKMNQLKEMFENEKKSK